MHGAAGEGLAAAMANPAPIRDISRVVLQRMGGGTMTAPLTLWAGEYAPPGDEGSLIEVTPNSSLEDFAGEINGGNFTVSAFTSQVPTLTTLPGGFLEGLTDTSYCLATAYESVGGDEVPKYVGRVEEVSASHMDGQTILTCDMGLVIWRHITDDKFGAANPCLQGRWFGWMANRIITALGAQAGEIQSPAIQYDKPYLSFAEHPEYALITNDIADVTPNSYTRALAYGGGRIWACVKQKILSYDLTIHEWEYHGAYTGMTAITGYDFCVIGLNYEAGVLRALLEHLPVSVPIGSSPSEESFRVYEITHNLTTGVNTTIRTWYQHTHERIASRALRYACNGSGGTAYASAEAIGAAIPAPPDQTYADTRYPQNSVIVWLPVGSFVQNNMIVINGTGLSFAVNNGIMVYIDGRSYYPGYITNIVDDGVATTLTLSESTGIFHVVTAPATDFTANWLPAYSFTPNVYIGYPTMVDVELSPITGSNPRKTASVKVFRRNSAYSGAASHISLDTGITLPAELQPGWYAILTQTGEWADHPVPSTDKTEADAVPFVITFERPRYICDFANGWTQRDTAHDTPPGVWDHRQGRLDSVIYYNNVATIFMARSKTYSKQDRALTTGSLYDLLYDTNFWAINDSGILSYEVLESESRYTHGNAYIFDYARNYHHIAEQSISYEWVDTGGEIAAVVDTGNLAPYPYGISHDLYCLGAVDLNTGDIIGISEAGTPPTNNDQIGRMVDLNESLFSPSGLGAHFYTRTVVYPQLGVPSSAVGKHIWKLVATRRLGRWIRYDADWTNMVVLHNCVRDTARDIDGQLTARIDANDPPGQKFTITTDDTGLCKVKLDAVSLTLPTVLLKNRTQIRVLDSAPFGVPLTYPIPPGKFGYYMENCGDNRDETWIVFNNALAGTEIYVQAQYYSDDYWISDFWVQGGNIYAMEEGTGLILKYDGSSVTVHQDLGRGEDGGNALAIAAGNDSWIVTAPGGYLAKFSQNHSGHVDSIVPTGGRLIDLLGLSVQSMGMLVNVDADGKINIRRRDQTVSSDALDAVRPTPTLKEQPTPRSVRVNYLRGAAQAGKQIDPRGLSIPSIDNYNQALWNANLYYAIDTSEIYEIVVRMEQEVDLMNIYEVNYPFPIIDEHQAINVQVMNLAPKYRDQMIMVTARRI